MDILSNADQDQVKAYIKKLHQPNFTRRHEKMGELLESDPILLASLKKKCDGKKSYEDIFSSIWDLQEAHDILTPTLGPFGKSDILADMLRNEGNDYFRKQIYNKALERYNLSILISPHPVLHEVTVTHNESMGADVGEFTRVNPLKYYESTDEESISLAKGYANRSAVMLEICCFEKCIRDIDLAIKFGYPKELRAKLESRKKRCRAAQINGDIPIKDLSISDKESESDGVGVYNGIYNQSMATIKEHLDAVAVTAPKVAEPNPTIPTFSSSVKVTYTSSKGRGVIAVRNITPGEVLGVEHGYCVSLLQAKVSSHCNYCLRLCIDPLPCPGCAVVLFCNDSCRTRALTEDHWIECKLLPTLVTMDMASYNLEYKMLRRFSYGQISDMLSQLQKEKHDHPEYLGCNKDGIYSSASYRPIYHMCNHKEKHTFEELLKFCQLSFVITKLLHQTERYFVNDRGEPFTPSREDFVATGALLISHMMKVKFNVEKLFSKKQACDVGSGMYPALSLINHSCNPPAFLHNYGRTIILRAVRPILIGEEVTVSYGPQYQSEEWPARKRNLKKFHFTCTCVACEEHWPINVLLPKMTFKCVKCSAPMHTSDLNCRKCRVNYRNSNYRGNKKLLVDEWEGNVIKVEYVLKKAFEILPKVEENQDVTETELQNLHSAIKVIHKYTAMPCQAVNDVESIFFKYYHFGK